MDLEVRLDSEDPPCGSVLRKRGSDAPEYGDDDAVSFDGWLGLLAAVSALIRLAEQRVSAPLPQPAPRAKRRRAS